MIVTNGAVWGRGRKNVILGFQCKWDKRGKDHRACEEVCEEFPSLYTNLG